MQQLHEAGQKEFPLVVKGDVQGSIEAISGALAKISTDEVQARVVHSGVGGITESDISLAVASMGQWQLEKYMMLPVAAGNQSVCR